MAQSATAAVDYILQDVLRERSQRGAPTQGAYTAALLAAGVDDINDFAILQEPDIRALVVDIIIVDTSAAPTTPVGGTVTPGITQRPAQAFITTTRKLNAVEVRKLLLLLQWHLTYCAQNPTVDPVRAWFQLTRNTFNAYCASYVPPTSLLPNNPGGGGIPQPGPGVVNATAPAESA